ncbi:hypothetical protein NBRC3255_3220 [Gluconobacter thailandicus NBRC 3255]|nr:hypothetical protein NBRC3255_3220 [Gluconobacter thailandicus NBRC 3255]
MPPVLESAEHDLNAIATFIASFVLFDETSGEGASGNT